MNTNTGSANGIANDTLADLARALASGRDLPDQAMPKVTRDMAAQRTTSQQVPHDPFRAAPKTSAFEFAVRDYLNYIAGMLVKKNEAYGDSALNPVRIFSQAGNEEQLHVRIDDKLSRVARGQALDEDMIDDLIGYLTLLKLIRNLGKW